MEENRGLHRKQLKAITAILQTTSIRKAARKAGVGEASIYRWKKMPIFKAELDKRRLELFNDGLNILKLSTKAAAKKLIGFLKSEDLSLVKWATREILNFAIKAAEIQDIEQRLERLEDKLF